MTHSIVACTAIGMGNAENTISLLLFKGPAVVTPWFLLYASMPQYLVPMSLNGIIRHSGNFTFYFSRFLYGNTLSVIEDNKLKIHINILKIL
jgi:hypothetical protein